MYALYALYSVAEQQDIIWYNMGAQVLLETVLQFSMGPYQKKDYAQKCIIESFIFQ